MANIKITSLPYTTTPLSGEEIVPVVQGGADAQATVNNILSPMNMTFQNIAAIHNTSISISIQNITCLSYANPLGNMLIHHDHRNASLGSFCFVYIRDF